MMYNSQSLKELRTSYSESFACNKYKKFKSFREPLAEYENQIIEFVSDNFIIRPKRIMIKDIYLGNGYIDHIWVDIDKNISKAIKDSKKIKVKGIVSKYPKPNNEYNFGVSFVIGIDILE